VRENINLRDRKLKKLNQVLAIERATKNVAETEFTKIYQTVGKAELLTGHQRTYRPKDEDGEKFPSESKKVQFRADDQIKKLKETLSELFNVVATKDATNCTAKADIVIDNKVLVKDVPATYLLFLDKKLTDLLNFAKKLPVLDQSEQWRRDEGLGLYATDPVESIKTKKVSKFVVVVQPTPQHPAQVKEQTEDVVTGSWLTVKYSGALPQDRVNEIIERVEKMQKAVRFARQTANSVDTVSLETGEPILGYIFG
jgi:hypothetical protein